jgi:hypothetical protein
MKRLAAAFTVIVLAGVSALAAMQSSDAKDQQSRDGRNADKLIQFRAVDIFIDSKDQPLAAYQLEFKASKGDVKIVGIEGGEHERFRKPPYYDPQAMQHERVIIAAFNTAPELALPTGRTRIATIHLQVSGDIEPEYVVKPSVLAATHGKKIQAEVEVKMRESSSSKQDAES